MLHQYNLQIIVITIYYFIFLSEGGFGVNLLNISISQEVKDHLRMRGSKTINIYTKMMTSC